jgi:hypothetical protein
LPPVSLSANLRAYARPASREVRFVSAGSAAAAAGPTSTNRPPDHDEAASAADQEYIEGLRLRQQRLAANP